MHGPTLVLRSRPVTAVLLLLAAVADGPGAAVVVGVPGLVPLLSGAGWDTARLADLQPIKPAV